MKKTLSILLCLTLIFSLAACGDKNHNTSPANDGNAQTNEENPSNIINTTPQENKDGDANKEETPSELQTTPSVADWNNDGVLKILTIGNSFSNNTMKYVYEIATACGVNEVYLGNLYIGGCTLDNHAENARSDKGAYIYYHNRNGVWRHANDYKMSAVISRENWDFISLQQASPVSGKADTYGELEYLINYVKSIANEDAKLIWNMTWAYQKDYNGLSNYRNDEMSRQDYMYKKIVGTVEEKVKTQPDFVAVIPCGTAIQNARTSYIGDNFTADGMHLNILGEYIAGLTMVYNLTGLPIENIEFSAGLDDGRKNVAIESVLNATKTPNAVTESVYKEKP